jgi:hypothetical protein
MHRQQWPGPWFMRADWSSPGCFWPTWILRYAESTALAWPGELIERHGREYEIWSGTDRVLLENVRFLAAYRRPGVVPDAEIERAWQSVQDGDRLAEAERRLAAGRPDHEARPPFLALLWSGRLTTDLSRPLSGDRVLRRSAWAHRRRGCSRGAVGFRGRLHGFSRSAALLSGRGETCAEERAMHRRCHRAGNESCSAGSGTRLTARSRSCRPAF